MHCDHCEKPALVHEVVIRNGKRREVHLCEDHAKEAGYVLPSTQPIAALLGQVMASAPALAKTSRASSPPACVACGLAFQQFRQTGVLGCSACYEAFGAPLASLIEKAHAGGLHHVGKTPRRGGGAIDLLMLRQRLERELGEAVAAEQYERAATLRDRMRELDRPTSVADDAACTADESTTHAVQSQPRGN